jgi:sterol desaturase/sphingolipid hydroxylase (fatty acid hydroxylase superfamily)
MLTNIIAYAIPGFLLLLVAEAIAAALMKRDVYEFKDTVSSLTMGIGNVIVNLFAKAMVFGIFTFVHKFAIFKIGFAWWAWVLCFFADEISYYTFHRTSHECRLWWASHVIHHSSQRYNLGTALRQTWTGSLYSFVFWIWMPLVGFPPVMAMTMQAISLLYQFWIHTELVENMGPLEWVLNTPSHHRAHHAVNARYLDKNHGGTLIMWDRLFGTFAQEDPADPPVYGLTKNIGTYNPVRIAFHEWVDMARDVGSAKSWGERLRLVLGRPGWKYERVNSGPWTVDGEAVPRRVR